MHGCHIRLWTLILSGLFAVHAAMAQSIEGTAFDKSGAIVPGARVMLMVDYVKKTETVTDEGGRFTFSGLEPGLYFVQIKQPRFSLSQQHVMVEAGRKAVVYAVLEPGRMSDEITVRGTSVTSSPGSGMARPYAPQTGGKIDGPTPLRPLRPRYPGSAQQAGIQGTVVLLARIKLDGTLDILAVLASPDPDLEAEARRAAAEARYDPMKLNGKPIECGIELLFHFQPENGAPII